MLRVLKQKAKGSSDDAAGEQIPCVPTTEIEISSPEPVPPHIVSHVPISIGSRTISSSAESTISSKSDASYQGPNVNEEDTTTIIDVIPAGSLNQVIQAPDSQDESCSSAATDTALRPRSSQKALTRSRTISWEESPMTKKPRLNLNCTSTDTSGGNLAKLTLLALKEDDYVLSPLHAFVRKQIEVFTATPFDLKQPAPGRKQAIGLYQVGLRCIHCKDNASGKRVKRAVCYPSNVKRIYHSVSDMKFDHFSNCTSLPADVRAQFESLKAEGTKRNGDSKGSKRGPLSSTAQYYHDSAVSMGMLDGPGGIFMVSNSNWSVDHGQTFPATLVPKNPSPSTGYGTASDVGINTRDMSASATTQIQALPTFTMKALDTSAFGGIFPLTGGATIQFNAITTSLAQAPKTTPSPPGARITLHEDSDRENLNKIHCFVRKHVELFAADDTDMAAPSPGRKTRVVLGQVGIRCVHCTQLPTKHRVKRAICYPPSIHGIYHAVSNMKFDHFANCRGLPVESREEFRALQDSCCRKGSGGGTKGTKGTASSTAKYYQESAIRKGLVDTDSGIRLATSPGATTASTVPSQPLVLPTGLLALVKAACQAA